VFDSHLLCIEKSGIEPFSISINKIDINEMEKIKEYKTNKEF